MSEDPASYWIGRPHPQPSLDGQGWCATFSWRDAISGHELRWVSDAIYSTRAEALLAACDAEADPDLRDRLVAGRPGNTGACWRNPASGPFCSRPPRITLPSRPFADWEREVQRRLGSVSSRPETG
jgi:hypothetical protein